MVANLLIHFVADNNLEEMVEEDGMWIPDHGIILVDNQITGSAPLNFRRKVKISVKYAQIVDEPDQAFEVMSDEWKKYQNVEDCMASTRQAQHQQMAAPT